MANVKNLAYDWRFNVVDEPTEWAFNWEYAEGGTTNPTPREFHATWFITMNTGGDQIADLKRLFKEFGKKNPNIELIVRPMDEDNIYKLKVKKKNTDIILLEGEMVKRENDERDPNVGNYATYVSKTKAGLFTIQEIINEENGNKGFHGFQTLVQHKRVETQLKKGFRLVSVTGVGPDGGEGGGDGGDNSNDEENNVDFIGGLATRFALYSEDEEVARCHLTYQNGSWDKSMGPTIEMISVKQPRRGEGLAKLLCYWVNIFVEEIFRSSVSTTTLHPVILW
jgi:hypothetical protein